VDVPALLAAVGPATVVVSVGAGPAGGRGGAGSGVVVDGGLVVTNAHVVGLATVAEVTFASGERVAADLVGSFPAEDIAVLAPASVPDGVVAARLVSSEATPVGAPVVAIGNALGLGVSPTVTSGILSARDRELSVPGGGTLSSLLQTDAAINPGNSGGPLLNASGEVIGINTAIAAAAQNIGFAIPAEVVLPLVDAIRSGGGEVTPQGAFLGVTSVDGSALEGGLPAGAPEGAVVTAVVPGSPAAAAGVRPGDVLVGVGDVTVRTPEEVGAAVRSAGPGPTRVRLWRDGDVVEVEVVLVSREEFSTGG
jgi:S1-C subfamily serine protease